MEYIILYAVFCLIVGWIGSGTTLGFGSAFLLSVLLTPLTGFIICLFYPSASNQRKRLSEQQKQTELLQKISTPNVSIADELAKLKALHEKKILTDEEFEVQKNKLLA